MRRLVTIFMLILLPLQAFWVAAEPYCQHEQGQAAVHVGHHVHDHHADGDGVDQSGHDEKGQAQAKASPLIDHDHHCGACLCMLVATPQALPEALAPSSMAEAPMVSYVSFDASRIERPNWAVPR